MHSSQAQPGDDPGLPPLSERDSVPPSTSVRTGDQETGQETLTPVAPFFPHVQASFGADQRYWLIAKIASGGMGVVYKALQRDLGRLVALKIIHPRLGLSEDRVLRFEREARAAARLQHTNIVPIFEIGTWQGQSYYTMAYAAGGSLAEHRHRFNQEAAALLVEKVARGLAYAHANGVLHRDLKPSNILLRHDDEPLISDFGLAKLWDGDVELTREGEILGTPAYMAPEQAVGDGAPVSGAADVWALGVIFYELLAGQRPFPGKTRDDVLTQIRTREPESLRALDAAVELQLEAIVLRCLEKDLTRRYTAAQLADDLARRGRHEPPRTRPDSRLTRAWREGRRRVQQVGLFHLLALIILLLILIRLWLPPPPPPPGAPPPFGPPHGGPPPRGAPPPPWKGPPPERDAR